MAGPSVGGSSAVAWALSVGAHIFGATMLIGLWQDGRLAEVTVIPVALVHDVGTSEAESSSSATTVVQPMRVATAEASRPELNVPPREGLAAPDSTPPKTKPLQQKRSKPSALEPALQQDARLSAAQVDRAPAQVLSSADGSSASAVATPAVSAPGGIVTNPPPAYPDSARRRGWEGDVVLLVRVAPDGRCAGVEIVRSSGRAILDEAAVDAVKLWRFVPARRGEEPVAAQLEVPVSFRLRDARRG
ncbi:MAG: energy transducer TonB [Alphaproteobacteria bacterium]|nr:energy transducer TonB [Alphaproteobacteria bacterium]